jgi:hypothetical protein
MLKGGEQVTGDKTEGGRSTTWLSRSNETLFQPA